MEPPQIAVVLNDPGTGPARANALLKRSRYLDGVRRGGGEPLALDPSRPTGERDAVLARMDGLLITGGGDLDPARYGATMDGSDPPDASRDQLDEAAYHAAVRRGVPILGICRGLQVLNAFEGGRLVQHLEGHESPSYPDPEVTTHPIRVVAGTRLAEIVGNGRELVVNSYHHQAVARDGVPPSLRVTATAPHEERGELVEGLEAVDAARWLVAVQCHPERTESSPTELERIWPAFVDACRTQPGGD